MEDTFFHDKFQVIFLNSFKGGKKPSFLHPERSNILLKSWGNNFLDEECFCVLLQEKFSNFSATPFSCPLRQLFRTSPPEARNELGWAANTAFPPWMAGAVWLGQGRSRELCNTHAPFWPPKHTYPPSPPAPLDGAGTNLSIHRSFLHFQSSLHQKGDTRWALRLPSLPSQVFHMTWFVSLSLTTILSPQPKNHRIMEYNYRVI